MQVQSNRCVHSIVSKVQCLMVDMFHTWGIWETRKTFQTLRDKSARETKHFTSTKSKYTLKELYMDWIHLAPDSDQKRVLVETIMNLRVS
jgi:hypothetical protein